MIASELTLIAQLHPVAQVAAIVSIAAVVITVIWALVRIIVE